MTTDQNNHEEALRRLMSRVKLESPSAGFSQRVMDRLLVQPEPVRKWVLIYQKVYC